MTDDVLPPARTPSPVRALVALVLLLGGAGLALAFLMRGIVSTARDAVVPAPIDAPTLLLVTLDSVRADRISAGAGAAGADTTPFLAALVEGGAARVELRARSEGTNGSVATLLTGLDPAEHDVRSLRRRGRAALPEACATLAERLSARGWSTFAAVALPQLDGALSGLDRGFETYLEARPDAGAAAEPAERLVARTRAALEGRLAEGRPLFAWFHLADPRALEDPGDTGVPPRAAEFLAHHLRPLRGRSTVVDRALALEPSAALADLHEKLARRRGSPEQVAFLEAVYDGHVRDLDEAVGELVRLVDARRVEARLAVVGLRAVTTATERARAAHGEADPDARATTPGVLRGIPAPAAGGEPVELRRLGAALAAALELPAGESAPEPAAPRAGLAGRPAATAPRSWVFTVELSDDAAGDVSARLVVPGVEDGAAESVRLAPGRTWELASDDPVPLELVLRRSAGEDPPLAEPAVTWGGRPLPRAPVLRVATERGDPWPEDAGEPVVDVEHEQGRWLRVRVPGARDGQEVRVLVALTPPADLPEPPRVRDERGVERSAPLACREVHELVGTTPLSFSVRKLSTEALALSVALDGVQVPARVQRYRGRRASRADELRLFVPAWQPGVSPADSAAERDGEHAADDASAGPAAGGPGEVHLTPWYPVGVPPRRDPADLRAPPPGHRELLRRLPRTE